MMKKVAVVNITVEQRLRTYMLKKEAGVNITVEQKMLEQLEDVKGTEGID